MCTVCEYSAAHMKRCIIVSGGMYAQYICGMGLGLYELIPLEYLTQSILSFSLFNFFFYFINW